MEIRKVEYSCGNKQLAIEWIKYNFPHLTALIPLIQRTMDSISNFCCLMKQPFILCTNADWLVFAKRYL